jgi:hypothetical protein
LVETLAPARGANTRFPKMWLHTSRPLQGVWTFLTLYCYLLILISLNRLIYVLVISPFLSNYYVNYTVTEIFNYTTLISALIFTILFWTSIRIINRHFPKVMKRLLPEHGSLRDVDTDPSKELREAFDNEIGYSEAEAMVSNRLLAINTINARVNDLRVRSTWMLLVIGLLLIIAAITVIFAGSLTNLDVSAASDVDKINQDIAKIETRLGYLSDISDQQKIIAADNTQKDEKDLATRRLNEIIRSDNTLPKGKVAVEIEIEAARNALHQDQTLLNDAWTRQLASEHGYKDTRYLIATAITRIGVILVIVFLVQILIGLYRYNTRLITFYSSRNDALQLWDGKPASIEKFQKIMLPNIDFGREPKHPLEDLMRQVIAKVHVPGTGASG